MILIRWICVLAFMQECLSVRHSGCPSLRPSVCSSIFSTVRPSLLSQLTIVIVFFLSFNIVKGRKFNVTTASTAVRISDFNFAVLLMLVAMVVVLMAATYQTRRDILTRIGE